MNKERKLAYFTAVNIDGKVSKDIERERDKWFLDPRINESEQTNNAVYASNPLDRGHLVRRLDPAWGDTGQLPKQFWKVVVMVKEDGSLSAMAYLLSQESLLQDLEEFSFGAYKTYQVPVRKVEELTGLEFGDLKSFDPIEALECLDQESLAMREIASYEDLKL